MHAAIHLHVNLLAVLALVAGLLFMVAPRIYQWSRNARWDVSAVVRAARSGIVSSVG